VSRADHSRESLLRLSLVGSDLDSIASCSIAVGCQVEGAYFWPHQALAEGVTFCCFCIFFLSERLLSELV